MRPDLTILVLLTVTTLACSHASTPSAPVQTDGYATVNGVRLHYVSNGSGPLILFVHGFPEFWYAWKDQLAEFGRDHQAVAVDMRGYNLSDKPTALDAYRISNMVQDIDALATHFGARTFVLVAHDWGGAIAWNYAMTHPERLERLIIINAPHPGVFQRLLASDPAQQQASQYMLMFRSSGAEQLLSANNYQRLVVGVLSDLEKSGHFTSADSAEYIKAWSQPGALTGGLNYYRASRAGPPVAGDTARAVAGDLTVRVPTLVIWGEQDKALVVGNLNGLDTFVPNLTIKRVPTGSHWVVHEKPTEVNAFIREFIK